MSYDIDVFTITNHHSANYTSNVCEMYTEAFETIRPSVEHLFSKSWNTINDFKDAFNSGERDIILPVLQCMINELKANPQKYEPMNPDNGWGNYKGAIKFLEDAYESLKKNNNAIMRIDY